MQVIELCVNNASAAIFHSLNQTGHPPHLISVGNLAPGALDVPCIITLIHIKGLP